MALLISDHLNLRKITARYVPKQLTDFQQAKRVRICQENLAKFESSARRLCDVGTMDQSFLYYKQIGRKSSSAEWVVRGDPPRAVVRPSMFSSKTLFSIFFKSTGPVLIHYVDRGQTVNHQCYIDYCLKPLINSTRKQKLLCGVQDIKLHYDSGRPHLHKDVYESGDITIIPHLSNRLGLLPCDF